MEMIQESLSILVITIVCGAISVMGAYVGNYFKKLSYKAQKETEKIEDEAKKSLVTDAINRVDELVTINVVKMEQTLVKEIKEKAKDGKLDKEELKVIGATVQKDVLKQLGEDSKKLIAYEIGDLNSYVEAQIEFTLATLKNQI